MDINEQVALLMQGTEYGDEGLRKTMEMELRQRLLEAEREGRKLKVYCGYDPRTSDLHIGHTVTMRKLRQFQDLGHEVVFLIGTYTSLIGDPSDKDKLRPLLTQEQVMENARTYAEQAFRVLDRSKTTIRYNHEWLSGLTFADLIQLGSNFTIQQFLTRESFRKRWDNEDAIYLHEFFYALMQGYDAFALKTDVQVGGTDQLFNIITAGRKIMTALGEKPNIGIIMAILPGTDGVVKMSKSLGNHIPLNSTPEDMYGKVMSIPDSAMPQYARLVTRWLPAQVAAFEAGLQSGSLHPRDAKMKLAWEVTATYYSELQADQAQEAFVRLFQQGQIPEEMPEYALQPAQTVLDVLLAAALVTSKSEGRRMVEQKGVRLDGVVLEKADMPFPHPGVLQVGKRRFVRVK
ncbi:MAG: tyrosine--tRNA ligase [Anaerolineales bacterium]|nr:tyrosine--tRNA ligase [Anaerolineales bacterium]MDW8277651.1 tyrosine--tRNA ligase [Anaerolineales bacterium]